MGITPKVTMHRTARIVIFTLVLTLALTWFSHIAAYAQSPQAPPEDSPEWAKRQNELATQAARRGFWEEATYRWMAILLYYPNWAHIWNNLAIAMEAQGEWRLAEKYYQRAIKLDPRNQDIRANFLRFRALKRRFTEELRGRKSEPAHPTEEKSDRDKENQELKLLTIPSHNDPLINLSHVLLTPSSYPLAPVSPHHRCSPSVQPRMPIIL